MSKVKPSLGRGLDALIHQTSYKDDEQAVVKYTELKRDDGAAVNVIAKIPVELISPNPYQPRMHFDPVAYEELKRSILSNGLIQPITVRRNGSINYQLISGERRLKACIDIGYIDIPAYIIEVDSDEAMLALALIENIQREKLNPIEIGLAYKRLIDECHLTQEQIADKVGKDRSTIANSIRLLKLPKEVQQKLINEEITMGHARAIINLPSSAMQLDVLKKIIEGSLSVRKVEQLVKKLLTSGDLQKRSYTFNPSSHSSNFKDLEDKLRKIFGTKVACKQKQDGTGEITIEFYSSDELERLIELFQVIDKTYN